MSGESADSQFCEMKKVKAPAGWYEVRVSSSSTPAWLRGGVRGRIGGGVRVRVRVRVGVEVRARVGVGI